MPNTIGKYTLGRTLGGGASCKVKLAKDERGDRYAIKILHEDGDEDELIEDEINTLKKLKHPNIVNLIEVGVGEQHNTKVNKTRKVKYIVLELVGGGELYELLALGGRLEEKYARYLFKQLLDGLQYMQKEGYSHRDLKPKNLLFDNDYNLKIADFGFSAPLAGRDGTGLLQTILGTSSYMAPEIKLGQPYQGKDVDLFAAGITLFVILAHRPPFECAIPQDQLYRLLAGGKPEAFWKAHIDAENGDDIFSPEFKQLFE